MAPQTAEPSLGDSAIRTALRGFLASRHATDSETLILDELGIWGGEIRADLAVVNGCMHGFEIKSDIDTLVRLPRQIEAYSAVFDRATLVASPRHIEKARLLVPAWWGLICASVDQQGVTLDQLRQEDVNPSPQAEAIAAFLWRGEALAVLESLGLAAGVRSKAVPFLIQRLAESLTPDQLSSFVRQAFRARGDWRVGARRKQYDATFQRCATGSSCLSAYRRRIQR